MLVEPTIWVKYGSFLGPPEGTLDGGAVEGVKMGVFWVKTKRYPVYIICKGII